ncbi:MAG: lipoyl(octanoyl) transferase LipB [Cryomorphaceae bacterium]
MKSLTIPPFEVVDLGSMSFADALIEQESRFNAMLDAKRKGTPLPANTLLLVEHTPVYTLGKSGDLNNLRKKPEEVGAEFYKATRGGDITYHGPGQIVGYPIFDLEGFDMGIAQYIWSLEEIIIRAIARFGLRGGRISDASGVWLDIDNERVRKICAIGVKASRYVTMHGFAFNVNTDLRFFDHIIPCGIEDKGVTSMKQELGEEQDFELLKSYVVQAFSECFLPPT